MIAAQIVVIEKMSLHKLDMNAYLRENPGIQTYSSKEYNQMMDIYHLFSTLTKVYSTELAH